MYEGLSIEEIDKILREKERKEYEQNPDLKMPMMLPIDPKYVRVIWPKKFK